MSYSLEESEANAKALWKEIVTTERVEIPASEVKIYATSGMEPPYTNIRAEMSREGVKYFGDKTTVEIVEN